MRSKRIFLFFFPALAGIAQAAVKPSQNFLAEMSKKNHYILEGTVVGGDKSVVKSQIADLRHSPQGTNGYERAVLELRSAKGTDAVPHYELIVSPEKKRLILSVWGSVSYGFKKEKAETLFKKSRYIEKLNPIPIVEEGLATLEFVLRDKAQVEVFHLANPPRIVLDFKR